VQECVKVVSGYGIQRGPFLRDSDKCRGKKCDRCQLLLLMIFNARLSSGQGQYKYLTMVQATALDIRCLSVSDHGDDNFTDCRC